MFVSSVLNFGCVYFVFYIGLLCFVIVVMCVFRARFVFFSVSFASFSFFFV